MTTIEICAVIATIAFVCLVIYAILLIKSLVHLTKHIDTTLEPLSLETFKILQNTSQATSLVHRQLESVDPLVQSISSAGQSLKHTTQALSEEIENRRPKNKDKIADICELIALSITVCRQIKNRR